LALRRINERTSRSQIGDTLLAQPPIERQRRRLGERIEDDPIEVQERQATRRHPQRVAGEIGLRGDLAEQRDRDRREEEGAEPGEHRIRQQREKDVGAHVAPDYGREHAIGILAQREHARRIGVAVVGLDPQAQLAEAEDREIEPGKQRRLHDADRDAKPDRNARGE
jgi:hypothetical protein